MSGRRWKVGPEMTPLDRWRRLRRMTTQRLADDLGVAQSAAHRYCQGIRIPRPEIMTRIAEVTGGAVGPADFYPALRVSPPPTIQTLFPDWNEMPARAA